MVLRPDQDRVRVMLKDTITLLCKNGLSFKTKFCIDAVIGVTLDDNDIFLVSMNEMVKSDKVNNDSDGASSDDSISSEQKRRRRRRIRNKRRSTESVESDVGQDPDEDNPEPSSMSKTRSPTKVAKIEQEEQEESQDDIMFIKQERSDEQWSQAASNMDFPDFSNLNSTQDGGDGHFPLSDMNLIPISQEGTSSTLQQYAAGPSSTKTFPTTAGNQSMSQVNWQEHNQSMSMLEFVEEDDHYNYDIGMRYRWHWKWLDHQPEGHPPLRHCIRKLKQPGVAFCVCCNHKIVYKSKGICLVKEHISCKKHSERCCLVHTEKEPEYI